MNKSYRDVIIGIAGILVLAVGFKVVDTSSKGESKTQNVAKQSPPEKLEKPDNSSSEKENILKIINDKNSEVIAKLRALDQLEKIDKPLADQLRKPLHDKIDRETKEVEKQSEIAEVDAKKQRKKQGVRTGMSMQDVIDSSWGKPQHITKYQTSDRHTEIWQYGRYGERGSLMFEDGTLTMIQN